MASVVADNFRLLFDRPNEPMVTTKGVERVLFKLTKQFLGDEYKNDGIQINSRFGVDASRVVELKNLLKVPKFTKAKKLPTDAEFSVFLPAHQEMADEVIAELLAVPENQLQDLLSTCVYARVNLNPQLFNYCYTVALMHSTMGRQCDTVVAGSGAGPMALINYLQGVKGVGSSKETEVPRVVSTQRDTRNIPIQNFAETFPAKFVDSIFFAEARKSAALANSGAPRTPITIPRDFTASDLDIEHRMAYWREDIGVNLHHWHWHLVYPFSSTQREIVAKDRRGELFYYMHQQVIARYNGERLLNHLTRVKKFSDFTEPIPEAYYPKLDSLTTSRGWPPRQAHMRWSDLNRPEEGLVVTIDTMNQWRKNIQQAISSGWVKMPNGSTQPLDIDTLGNIIESSILSPNREFYGSLHNNGHSFAGYMHDPNNQYLESFQVMADEAVNMRDPFFYRWHAFIDDLFQKFKESGNVPPYSHSELANPGVQITSVRVESGSDGGTANTLNTFWMQSDVDLSRGLDFSDRGPVYARFTHLNHRPFRYTIEVNNTGNARRSTVRIFMSPKFDERKLPWILNDQRKMMIEMDRFVVPLRAGQNTIVRQSTQSSLTIPFERTFRDLSAQGSDATGRPDTNFAFCGCGWPQHMLVPKGTETGIKYDLFVMLSNYDLDSVNNLESKELTCDEASSFCGLKDRLYPDRRSMGYPFDRPSVTADNIEDFVANLPNMSLTDITIRLQNITEQNPRNPTN